MPACSATKQDWGADSLTYALYLRWQTAHDASIPPVMAALTAAAPGMPARAPAPSLRLVERRARMGRDRRGARVRRSTGDADALAKAEAAFAFVERLRRLRARRLPGHPLPAAVRQLNQPEDARDRRERDQGRDPAAARRPATRSYLAVGDRALRRGPRALPRPGPAALHASTSSTTATRAPSCRTASSPRSTAT